MSFYLRIFLHSPLLFTWIVFVPLLGRGQSIPSVASPQASMASYLQELETGNAKQRLATVNRIVQASPALVDIYLQMLEQPFPSDPDSQIANKALLWFAQHPPSSSKDGMGKRMDFPQVNWLQALINIEESDWKKALSEMKKKKGLSIIHPNSLPTFSFLRANLLLRVSLLQALGEFGTQEKLQVVRPLFNFSFLYQGLFREECRQILQKLGEYTVPELTKIAYTRYRIQDKKTKGERKEKNLSARIAYAKDLLDAMDRQMPFKALNNISKAPIQVALLQVYGEVQYQAAVKAVLSYTNDRALSVRSTARTAFLNYVEGPAPDPVPTRYRKQAKGVVEQHAKPDFYDFRQIAKIQVQNALQQAEVPFSKQATLKEMTLLLFSFYDNQRKNEWDALFEKGKKAENLGQFKQATDLYQFILLHQPDYLHRSEMADAFYKYGESLAQQGEASHDQNILSQAIGYLRRAVVIFPNHPSHARIEARYHYLDGIQVQALRGDGSPDFEWALQVDPTYEEASRALALIKK